MLDIKKTINGYESTTKGGKEFILLPVSDYEKLLIKATPSVTNGAEQALACSNRSKETALEMITKFKQLKGVDTVSVKPKFLTVRQVPEFYGETFPVGGIRHLIFNAQKNGFHNCVKRAGRKILIDTDEFDRWIASNK
jgi:hypothetical protein